MGYMLGNHTWNHATLTTLSASAQAAEMDHAAAEQVTLTSVPPCGFRPGARVLAERAHHHTRPGP